MKFEPGMTLVFKKDLSEKTLKAAIIYQLDILKLNHREEYEHLLEELFEVEKPNSVNFILDGKE